MQLYKFRITGFMDTAAGCVQAKPISFYVTAVNPLEAVKQAFVRIDVQNLNAEKSVVVMECVSARGITP
jgi:hypothetical protein